MLADIGEHSHSSTLTISDADDSVDGVLLLVRTRGPRVAEATSAVTSGYFGTCTSHLSYLILLTTYYSHHNYYRRLTVVETSAELIGGDELREGVANFTPAGGDIVELELCTQQFFTLLIVFCNSPAYYLWLNK